MLFASRSRTLGVANSAGFPIRSFSLMPRALLDMPDRKNRPPPCPVAQTTTGAFDGSIVM